MVISFFGANIGDVRLFVTVFDGFCKLWLDVRRREYILSREEVRFLFLVENESLSISNVFKNSIIPNAKR